MAALSTSVAPMIRFKLLLACGAIVVLSGCAHSIAVPPNTAAIVRAEGAPPRIKASVGYFIPAQVVDIEVTTGGGGGERVRYYRYKDIDAAFRLVLLNVFENVSKLTSEADPAIARENIKYVVTPSIVTNSGSTSAFTWPPTDFTVDLTSTVKDGLGKDIVTKRVIGHGQAEWSEFTKQGFGLAGSRAMEDAVKKMQTEMFALGDASVPAVRTPAASALTPVEAAKSKPSGGVSASVAERLAELKSLSDRGLITPAEYDKKRRDILESL